MAMKTCDIKNFTFLLVKHLKNGNKKLANFVKHFIIINNFIGIDSVILSFFLLQRFVELPSRNCVYKQTFSIVGSRVEIMAEIFPV